jgi:hypothetical protein
VHRGERLGESEQEGRRDGTLGQDQHDRPAVLLDYPGELPLSGGFHQHGLGGPEFGRSRLASRARNRVWCALSLGATTVMGGHLLQVESTCRACTPVTPLAGVGCRARASRGHAAAQLDTGGIGRCPRDTGETNRARAPREGRIRPGDHVGGIARNTGNALRMII